jgi:hypothetical protein
MSDINMIDNPKFGREEVGIEILKRAADHIYSHQNNGDPGNYRAVDLMDDLRADIQDRIDSRWA